MRLDETTKEVLRTETVEVLLSIRAGTRRAAASGPNAAAAATFRLVGSALHRDLGVAVEPVFEQPQPRVQNGLRNAGGKSELHGKPPALPRRRLARLTAA